MDGMIEGVGEMGEEERESKEIKRDGWSGGEAKQQRLHSHELLIPANYLLTAALSLVIPLPVYHHSLCRWEQSVAICETITFSLLSPGQSHPPAYAHINIGVLRQMSIHGHISRRRSTHSTGFVALARPVLISSLVVETTIR
jgi:hypothetical protein